MQIIVKTKFEEDLRRFNVKTEITLKDICATTCELYRLLNVRLKYKDEEGDLITITTNNELREAINLALQSKPQILRLEVESCEVEMNDSWIVLPNENVPSEFPPIFGFQLPLFDDYLEEAFQNLSIDRQLSEEQIEPEVPKQTMNEKNNQEEIQPEEEVKTSVVLEDLTPQTRRRIKEICADLAVETRNSCVNLSNETLNDVKSYWNTTAISSTISSSEIRQQCLAESEQTMNSTKDIPFLIVESSTAISTETLNSCAEASAGVMKACLLNSFTDLGNTNQTLWTTCNQLSNQTSRDCQDLASKLVAEILAL